MDYLVNKWARKNGYSEDGIDDFGDINSQDNSYVDSQLSSLVSDSIIENSVDSMLENPEDSGIMESEFISGALNPLGERAEKHATRYYESVRKMKTDVKNIAKNTGFSEFKIQKIKDFIFVNKHDLGNGDLERFYPSYEMAQSWQRLINGTDIQLHDLLLLEHEFLEESLMERGYTQSEAHILASRKYNYKKGCEEYYAKIKKYKDNR